MGGVNVGLTASGIKEAAHTFDEAARSFPAEMRSGMQRITVVMEADLRETAMAAAPVRRGLFWYGPDGPFMGRRSGRTVASLTSRIARSGNEIIGAVGSPLEHSALIEEGGTLKPSRARAMAIPTIHATTNRGALSNRFAGASSLRQIDGLFRLRSKDGERRDRGWLAMKFGKEIRRMFMLTSSVTIRPKHYMEEATKRIAPMAASIMENKLSVFVNRMGR
jgi:hypothetical protein